jgi:hypothetical protein
MKHTHTRTLYDYWDALRLSRAAPLRSELDPRAIKSLLTNMFILQRLSETDFRFRLAGTGMCQRFGRELRDENFLGNWRSNEAASIRSLLQSITQDRTAAVVGVTVSYDNAPQDTMEYLFLPVRLDTTQEIRILGCCSLLDETDRRTHSPIVGQKVASLRLLWPDNVSRFMETTTPKRSVDVAADRLPPPHQTAQQRGHLWVIEGGAK